MATSTTKATTKAKLVPLPLLADEAYDPNTFHYLNTEHNGMPKLADWIEVFRKSISGLEKAAAADVSVDSDTRKAQAEAFAQRYHKILDTLAEDPDADIPGFGSAPVCCVRLCSMRDTVLREAGFWDPYAEIKAQENIKALKLLPDIISELDQISDPSQRLQSALMGVFAGNIFDLGAAASTKLFEEGGDAGDMFTRAKRDLVDRPWAVDKLDDILKRFAEGPAHKKALVFCDNAGSDVILGMLPFCRELLKRGTRVVVAVNSVPSINDITLPEMNDIVDKLPDLDQTFEAAISTGQFRIVGSGNDLPVIDLRYLGEECAVEAEDTDLVVLEGMGRGIETNLWAKMTCESMKLAMIKHPEVATCLGGRLYDCACQYHPGTGGRAATAS